MPGNIFQIRKINNQQTINSNRFSLTFPGLKTKLSNAVNSPFPWIKERYAAVADALKNNTTGADIDESLELSLLSITLPSVGVDVTDIARFNDQIKAITKFKVMEEMVVTFMDYVNGSASAIMQLWHAFVADKKTGAIGFKQDFVLPTANFMVYGPDAPGYDVQSSAEIPYLQKYEIVNIYPINVNLGEHAATTAEPRKVVVNFIIDNIYPVDIAAYVFNPDQPGARYTKMPTPSF